MKKIILLVGYSGSGKDYLANALELKPVISNTERPMRPNEIDGVNKHFHKTGTYDNIKNELDIVAHTIINGYNYWTTSADLKGKDVFIVDPTGVQGLMEHYGNKFDKKFKVVVVKMNHIKRLYRIVSRALKQDTEKLSKKVKLVFNSIKRFFSDFYTFRNINKLGKLIVIDK